MFVHRQTNDRSMSTQTAACSCGQLRAICEGAPMRVSLCHCLECQKRTGSLFGVAARFQRERVTIEGRSTTYRRNSDDGNWVDFRFCPDCGSTVWWGLEKQPGVIAVAVGAFADPDFPMPARSVYQNRRHRWLELPEKIERI
jgi:hypothetical protein